MSDIPKTFEKAFGGKEFDIANKLVARNGLLVLILAHRLIDQNQYDSLKLELTEFKCSSELLGILKRADDRKVGIFFQDLVKCNQSHIVEMILDRNLKPDEFNVEASSREIRVDDNNQEVTSASPSRTMKRTNCQSELRSSTQKEVISRKRKPFASLNDVSRNDGVQAGSSIDIRKALDETLAGTPPKVVKQRNAGVVDMTFKLKDLRSLMGKGYDTPSIKTRLVSVGESTTPKKRKSQVKEYFEMRISDGESEARVVIYDKAELLLQRCKNLANADIVLEAGSYCVKRDYVGGALMQYIVLSSAPSPWHEH